MIVFSLFCNMKDKDEKKAMIKIHWVTKKEDRLNKEDKKMETERWR